MTKLIVAFRNFANALKVTPKYEFVKWRVNLPKQIDSLMTKCSN
jgi:hypothetical protein